MLLDVFVGVTVGVGVGVGQLVSIKVNSVMILLESTTTQYHRDAELYT